MNRDCRHGLLDEMGTTGGGGSVGKARGGSMEEQAVEAGVKVDQINVLRLHMVVHSWDSSL